MRSNPSKFTIIKGGRDPSDPEERYSFLSGSITDTRLMGVAAMFLSWAVVEGSSLRHLNQIFYLDFETRSIDTYEESRAEVDVPFQDEKERLIAALGGSPKDISEKEARFLVQAHSRTTELAAASGESREGMAFLLKPEITLSQPEYRDLMDRLCAPLLTPLYTINYFLMRAAALDAEGMAYLSDPGGFPLNAVIHPSDIPEEHLPIPFQGRKPAAFCLNQTEQQPGTGIWLSQSLTEREDAYYISNTALSLNQNGTAVTSASLLSEFRITDVEAAMMLRRTEYVTMYLAPEEDASFSELFLQFTRRCTETRYRNGQLFIAYFSDNDHAGSASYRINDDVKTVIYMSDQGEILVMNYSLDYALETEYEFLTAFLRYPAMFPGTRFEFPEPVLYEYINSDFDDFPTFLEYCTEEDPL